MNVLSQGESERNAVGEIRSYFFNWKHSAVFHKQSNQWLSGCQHYVLKESERALDVTGRPFQHLFFCFSLLWPAAQRNKCVTFCRTICQCFSLFAFFLNVLFEQHTPWSSVNFTFHYSLYCFIAYIYQSQKQMLNHR